MIHTKKMKFHSHSLECGGPLKPEIVQSTAYTSNHPASSVLILGEEDACMEDGKCNYWLAELGKTTVQGFTLRVDNCKRLIAGCQIKNREYEAWATKEFRVSGSTDENGPWEILVEDELILTYNGQ